VEQLSWLYRVRGNHHQQRWGVWILPIGCQRAIPALEF
jgi:hypothetical protein